LKAGVTICKKDLMETSRTDRVHQLVPAGSNFSYIVFILVVQYHPFILFILLILLSTFVLFQYGWIISFPIVIGIAAVKNMLSF
jgi:hypothetical protein